MALLEALLPLAEVAPTCLRGRFDNDFVDRLNYRYSALTFLVLGIVISARQYVGEPISCWAPAQFPHEWVEYTDKICWISNTYYVPMDKLLPAPNEPRELKIAYYQWVPIVIFIQALLFFVPSLVWKTLNGQSGIHVNKIVAAVTTVENGAPEMRDKTIRVVVRNLDRALLSQREYRDSCFVRCRQTLAKYCICCCGKRYGNYLVSLYLFVKLLYLANGIAQLFLLNAFLQTDYHLYGVQVLIDVALGKNGQSSSKLFPRVTMCDFEIRALGNQKQVHTVQCVLPINLFNEKIYIFIWFWLVVVSLLTVVNVLLWLCTLFRNSRSQFVKKHLKIMQRNFNKESNTPSKDFCDNYLRRDGIFVLRLIAKNTNDVLVGEIIQELWDHYSRHRENKPEHEV